MKKVVTSLNIGFCPGVDNSIKLINKIIDEHKYKHIYMLGEIIHNDIVINDLKKKGLKVIKDFSNLPKFPKNHILIIQSHGVAPYVYENLKKNKVNYIDSTCPLVKFIHKSIIELENQGYYPVIIGSKNHTEVKGIAGYTKNKPIIIGNKREVNKKLFDGINKIGIVVQSTFIISEAEEIITKIKKYVQDVKVKNTICAPTRNRQKELMDNTKKYKSVVVIGSKSSSNTNKLFNIGKKSNPNTFFIEKPEDIVKYKVYNYTPTFVTSGASAPQNIIEKSVQIIKLHSNSFIRFSNQFIPKIDSAIQKYFENKKFPPELNFALNISEAIKSFTLRKGKRIRPLLLLLSYSGFNKNSSTLNKEIIKIAAAIEMMHSFLLIHDDIMDGSNTRRGADSFHILMNKYYGNITYNQNIGKDIALVAGDIIFAEVIGIIASSKIDNEIKNRFLKYFSECYSLTGWGQILDSLSSMLKQVRSNSKVALNVSTLKTAYYTIFYPMVMGYILVGGKSLNIINSLQEFAIPLGIAFQIRDDILGTFGNRDKTGKSNISDITEGKLTILISETLRILKGDKKSQFLYLFSKPKKSLKEINQIKQIIKESNAFEISTKRMNRLFAKAEERLNDIKINKESKYVLSDLIDLLKDFNNKLL